MALSCRWHSPELGMISSRRVLCLDDIASLLPTALAASVLRRGRTIRSDLEQRGARKTRDGVSGLPTSLLCETYSSGATRREESLLRPTSAFTCPVRIPVLRIVVGDFGITTTVGVDVIDLVVAGSWVVDIGYALTGRRVGRVVVVRIVLGDVDPASPVDVDRVDLVVAIGDEVGIGYLLAIRRVVGLVVVRIVVGDVDPASPVGVDRVDLPVGSAVVLVGDLSAARRVGRITVIRIVLGDVDLASPVGVDRVDLPVAVGSVLARIGYLGAVR